VISGYCKFRKILGENGLMRKEASFFPIYPPTITYNGMLPRADNLSFLEMRGKEPGLRL
jgi:hypothetical protein